MYTLHALNMSHLYLETSSDRLTKMERESTGLNPGYCKLTFEQIPNKCTSLYSTWLVMYTYVTNGRCVWPSLDSPFLYVWTIDWRGEVDTKRYPSYRGGGMILVQVERERESVWIRQTDASKLVLCSQLFCYLLHLCTKQVRGTGNSCATHDAL